MNKTKIIDGYEISWQEPPRTAAFWEFNIASEDVEKQLRLEAYTAQKGAYVLQSSSKREGLDECEAFIRGPMKAS